MEYNRNRGIKCVEGDLYENPFVNEFDLVTCLHAVFAFDDFEKILEGMITSLKTDGVLIVDIVNQNHLDATKSLNSKYPYKSGRYKEEICFFLKKMVMLLSK